MPDKRTPEELLAGIQEVLEPGKELVVMSNEPDKLPSDPFIRTLIYLRGVEQVHDAAAKAGNWQAQLSALKLGIMTCLAMQRRLQKDRVQKRNPVYDDGKTIDMSALTDDEIKLYITAPKNLNPKKPAKKKEPPTEPTP